MFMVFKKTTLLAGVALVVASAPVRADDSCKNTAHNARFKPGACEVKCTIFDKSKQLSDVNKKNVFCGEGAMLQAEKWGREAENQGKEFYFKDTKCENEDTFDRGNCAVRCRRLFPSQLPVSYSLIKKRKKKAFCGKDAEEQAKKWGREAENQGETYYYQRLLT